METMNGSITARLTGKDIKKIDSLIMAGLYNNRSDFLKYAARHLLREEAPEIPDLISRLQAQAKEKHISKEKILKDIHKVRQQLYLESFGDE
jgi:Arc/MetJ-type ribon-helix-helix transcriptional regulator